MIVILWDLVTGNAAGSYATVEEAIASLCELVRDHGPDILKGYGVEIRHDDGTVTAFGLTDFVDTFDRPKSAVSGTFTDRGRFPTNG